MESLLTILWKSASLTILFYCFYKLFLQKETYFKSIRYFLLSGIVASIVIPFIVVPIYVDTTTVSQLQQVVYNTVNTNSVANAEPQFSWTSMFQYIYFSIASILFIKLIIQLISILLLIHKNEITKNGHYFLVKTNIETSPFSFFNYIVYNPNNFNKNELNQILNHEKIHAIQKHSIDTLLSNLLVVFQWFNPMVWFYKKEVEQNLEFIADEYAHNIADSKKSYQQLLLKTTIPNYQMALANNFYNSLLKKRIIMLHKQRSNSKSQWRIAFIAPLLLAFIFTFNTKIVAQGKKEIKKVIEKKVELFAMGFTKNSSKEELDEIVKKFTSKGLNVKFKGIERNSNNEIIAIKIDAKATSGKASASYASDVEGGINPIQISFDNENNSLSIGSSENSQHTYAFSSGKKNKIIRIKGKGKNDNNNSFVFATDEDDDETNVWTTKKGAKKVIIEIDEDNDSDEDVHEIIIDEDDDGKEVKREIIKIKKKEGAGEEKMFFISSDNDGKNPLYILDGKEITQKEMDKLNPNSIKSIKVLKDGAATLKYGEKGKNGIILITTKKKE